MTHQEAIAWLNHQIIDAINWENPNLEKNYNGVLKLIKQAEADAAFRERVRPRRFSEELPPDKKDLVIIHHISELNGLPDLFQSVPACAARMPQFLIPTGWTRQPTHWFYPPEIPKEK